MDTNDDCEFDSDVDEECFYQMSDETIVRDRSEEGLKDEPSTPGDELDENFYEIHDEKVEDASQAYIDEPLTPSDEINPNFHYKILTREHFNDLMIKNMNEVKEILNLSSTIVRLLLNHYKWNKQRLLEQFYELDREQFFAQAKLVDPSLVVHRDETKECLICCSNDEKQMFSLSCQHDFCVDCWKNYLTNQIVNEGLVLKITCPDSECSILVDDQTIEKFLDENSFAKNIFSNLLLNAFVDENPRARWCPGKNCGHIVHATSLTSAYNYAQLIQCDLCKSSFCFHCGQSWHDPIKCQLLIQWMKKLFDDGQNVLWIKANTKLCPKCKVHIEKNGGCNHMTCRSCAYEFCWLCFGNWSKHNQCNRFNEANAVDPIQNQYGVLLNRYLHYYDRYRAHEHSLDLETKLFQKISDRFRRLPREISKNDIQTVEKAFDVLLKCRQMLIFTYPFAFYLKENNQSIVFEKNQEDLERSCESLSELLEQDVSKEIVMTKIKKTLGEKLEYCHARKNVLMRHVKEGYTNNYWIYNDEEVFH